MVITLSLSSVGCGELERLLDIVVRVVLVDINLCIVDVLETTWIHFFEML